MTRTVPRPSPFGVLRGDVEEGPRRRVHGLAVDLEGRVSVEHDVELLLATGLVVLVDQQAVLVRREHVDAEAVDPEMLAHRMHPAALLDVVEARDLPFGLSFIPFPSVRG